MALLSAHDLFLLWVGGLMRWPGRTHTLQHRLVIPGLTVPVTSDSHGPHSLRTDCARSHRRAAPDVPVGAAPVPTSAGPPPGLSDAAFDTQGVHASARMRSWR